MLTSNKREGEMVMNLNVRIIGKFGLLLAIIGLFMPFALDENLFTISDWLEDSAAATPLTIGLLILAVAGILIGVLLLIKNKVPIYVDWIILSACICISIGLFSLLKGEGLDFKNDLQSGAYILITGLGIEFIFLLIASFMNKAPYLSSLIKNDKKADKMAIASLILGIIVLFRFLHRYTTNIEFMPIEFKFLNMLRNLLRLRIYPWLLFYIVFFSVSIIGSTLGVIGILKSTKKGLAIAGLVLSIVGLIIGLRHLLLRLP